MEDLQRAVSQMDANIKLNSMRPIQRKAYECMAKCQDKKVSPNEERLMQCMQSCNEPLMRTQQVFQGEVQRFQQRLQRCAADCQDRAQDLMPSGDPNSASQADISKAQKVMDDCIASCAKSHTSMVPGLQKSIVSKLG